MRGTFSERSSMISTLALDLAAEASRSLTIESKSLGSLAAGFGASGLDINSMASETSGVLPSRCSLMYLRARHPLPCKCALWPARPTARTQWRATLARAVTLRLGGR